MRIVHLIDYYQPWMGYQEVYLCQEQKRMGHDVWVVTSDRYMPKTEKLIKSRFLKPQITVENGVNVCRLPVNFELHTNNGYVYLTSLRKALENIHPDIVHCHGIITLTSFSAAFYKRWLGYKLVYDNHTSLINLYHLEESHLKKTLKTASYKIVSFFINIFVLPRADVIVAIGEEEKKFLYWLFGNKADKSHIIHLGADHRVFNFNNKVRCQYRESFKWGDKDLILGHAGKLQPSKGIENLIRALSLIRNEKARIGLFLIGSIDSDYKQHLQKLASEMGLSNLLFFHPFASREELPKLLNTFDIAVWPGDITITAIEAMAVGLPIVTCRTSYTEAIIEKYSAGILIRRDDINELSLALKSMIDSCEKRKIIGMNARRAVESELNWESISEQFINIYQDPL